MEKREKGVSRFSIENYLYHSAENLRRESFTVALISGIEKNWIGGGGGEYPDIPSKFFCLITVPKKFVGESFTVALISGTEKVWRRGRREYQDFPSRTFCLTVPKISLGNPLLLH